MSEPAHSYRQPFGLKMQGEQFLDSHILPGDMLIFSAGEAKLGDIVAVAFNAEEIGVAYFRPGLVFAPGAKIIGVAQCLTRSLAMKGKAAP